jgi:hypothetical protein
MTILMHVNGHPISYTSIVHVDRGYVTDRHEFERHAKPWSELFEPKGPGLKSSLSPSQYGETKTRSLDQKANSITNQDGKNNDSSTPETVSETTTFLGTVTRYIRDIFLLTQHS